MRAGHTLVVTHGNGPQVGLLALQGAVYKPDEAFPLDVLGAETVGMIGYMIEQELENALDHALPVATLLTQVVVHADDPAFQAPSKFIGPVYDKAEAERLLAASGLAVTVLRLGAVIPIEVIGVVDPLMFEVPLEDRIEIVHPDDVGRAVVRAAERPDTVGRTLLIGGGPACRVRQRELMSRALGAVGVGMLPDDAFTTSPFHTVWLDPEESQALLDYQRHDLDDLIADMTRSVGWRRAPARVLAPVIRRALVRRSPYPARR